MALLADTRQVIRGGRMPGERFLADLLGAIDETVLERLSSNRFCISIHYMAIYAMKKYCKTCGPTAGAAAIGGR